MTNPWESLYSSGRHLNRYPWDVVVTFIMRNLPADRPKSAVTLLEVGCGTGSNLWFAAREGLDVTGLDISETAIGYANDRFKEEGLPGRFILGDLTQLPFRDSSFELVVDRAAITCLDEEGARHSVESVRSVLQAGGHFLFTPYSVRCDALAQTTGGMQAAFVEGISIGALANLGGIRFYDEGDVRALFKQGWRLKSMRETVSTDHVGNDETIATWQVVVEKE